MFWLFNVVVASFAVIPGAASATSIAAGVIYGTPVGVALVSTSSPSAWTSSFSSLVIARPLVERVFVKEGSRFAVLDQAVMRDGARRSCCSRGSRRSPRTSPCRSCSGSRRLISCRTWRLRGWHPAGVFRVRVHGGHGAAGDGGRGQGVGAGARVLRVRAPDDGAGDVSHRADCAEDAGRQGVGFQGSRRSIAGLCGGGSSSGDPDDDDDDDDIGEELLEELE